MSETPPTPAEPAAHVDAPEKPCAEQIVPAKELNAIPMRWCVREKGHAGPCSGPIPKPIKPSSYAAVRLRGLKQDTFADAVGNRSNKP